MYIILQDFLKKLGANPLALLSSPHHDSFFTDQSNLLNWHL